MVNRAFSKANALECYYLAWKINSLQNFGLITNMDIFSSHFWKKFLTLAKPYWYPDKEKARSFTDTLWAWLMLAVLVLLLLTFNSVNAFNSYVLRDLIDVIEEKNVTSFLRLVLTYIVTLGTVAMVTGLAQYLRRKISLEWYRWLTNYILDKYFHNRAYYKINFKSDIDNPDQRISQEIEPIPKIAMDIFFISFERIIEMAIFIGILWSISKVLAVVMIAYAIAGNLIVGSLGREMIQINSDQLERKGDYTYSLAHVRNHAESIAFFQGEAQELSIVKQKFSSLLQSSERLIEWQRNYQLFTNGYQSVINLFPFLLVAPLYFIDKIDLGEVSQATTACNVLAGALATLVNEFGSSGRFSNLVDRLTTLSDALEAAAMQPEPESTIETVEAEYLAFDHVTLQTPNHEQFIVEDLSLLVEPGAGLLIVGPIGRGKSSLLRAIAGLWNAGTGRIVRPNLEEILFLPQRPYLLLGTLREQLLYPNRNGQITDQELEQVLQQVNLQHLLTRVGGFDAEVYWENILSLGEQQRLAFARVLVTRPRYIILDEATSALDLTNEANLYQQLQETGTTFISVGHRESLFNYHQSVLELSEESNWRLVPTTEYLANSSEENQVNNQAESQLANVNQVPEPEPEAAPQTNEELFPDLRKAIAQAKSILKSKKSPRISLATLLSRIYSTPVTL
jgi:putative ATP-binding cassette transporter